MLYLVPFACARWEMTHCHLQSCFICQTLNTDLPQTGARAIAASTISQYQKFNSLGVSAAAHLFPPTQDGINGKIGCIMIRTNSHPSFILYDIIHTVGNDFAQFLVFKIVNLNFLRLTLWSPLRAFVLKISNQFFLPGVYRYHWLCALLKSLCRGQIYTRHLIENVCTGEDGEVKADPSKDLLKIAVIERHNAT